MTCREGISVPSSASVAVTKTKDISCDGASQLRAEPPEELLSPCLGCESGVNSGDGASHLLWSGVLH